MTAQLLDAIQGFSSLGLYFSMLLEGSSLPFPGLVAILAIGNILSPNLADAFWLALGMSSAYSLASFVPYFIGLKCQCALNRKFELTKVQSWFQKYGEWSICFSRPFGIGNYISYVAGMSNVNPWRYGILTFIGIFPWAYTMLLLASIPGRLV
ncbi:MAG: VTT domain-containing protein [Desulfitobacteriaceae bacterium]|nr:VTT domain-containing protein [Desulfitobacteriaceae bacterium]MDD3874887.1 VTT domain-containing protein [Methanosarcina sp.]MDD4753901.1 VTT domain-containing protein [Desulfitobacteriaceae bacterium]